MPDLARITLYPVGGLPLFQPGDDIAALLARQLRSEAIGLVDGDVVIVAQKIVSKSEGRYIDLDDIHPSARACELAALTGKDARHVEAVLSESYDIVRTGPNVIIAAHRLGYVMANAGVDESNIEHGSGTGRVLLLPRDPDASAAGLKRQLDVAFGVCCSVVINDSFGRPWRNGVVGVAIGAAGIPALVSRIGEPDLFGRRMKMTEIAVADEIAAAASLLMGQAAEGIPVVVLRGFRIDGAEAPARSLVRDPARDMFR